MTDIREDRKTLEFIDATFGRLAGVLVGGVKLEVQHLFVDGETTIAELRSTSTTIEGAAFANTYFSLSSRRPSAWRRGRG